jgi:hypothetical protein
MVTESVSFITHESGQCVQLFLAEMRRYDDNRNWVDASSAAELRYKRPGILVGRAGGEDKHRHIFIRLDNSEYFRRGIPLFKQCFGRLGCNGLSQRCPSSKQLPSLLLRLDFQHLRNAEEWSFGLRRVNDAQQ